MTATTVPALDKTFQILDLITASSQPLTAAQVAKELDLPRAPLTISYRAYWASTSSIKTTTVVFIWAPIYCTGQVSMSVNKGDTVI